VSTIANTTGDTVFCSYRTGDESGLIAMHPRKDVKMLAGPSITPPQLRRWTTDGHRARLSSIQNNKHYKGILTMTPGQRLKAFYLPRTVQDSGNNTLVLGTASNYARPFVVQPLLGACTRFM
jgi:hypothetical protein